MFSSKVLFVFLEGGEYIAYVFFRGEPEFMSIYFPTSEEEEYLPSGFCVYVQKE